MKRHTAREIALKLRQAEELIAHGQSQSQACKALGVSVMTFHRWRKLNPAQNDELRPSPQAPASNLSDTHGTMLENERRLVDELKLENDRLRRIVTDLLLEKMKIQEELGLKGASKPSQRSQVT